MDSGIPIGSIRGIPLRVDWSVAIVAWLIAWVLATEALPELAPGYSTGLYWVSGALTSVVFLVSLLTHEMSHSLVARNRGVRVRSITLWLFGGVATLEGEARTPGDELAIAVAGPLASFAIAGAMLVTGTALAAAGAPDLLVAVAAWLGTINVVLAVFNLVPAAPLDGGRVLRALLWRRRGDRTSAALSATRAGRVFGYVLVGLGLLQVAVGLVVGGLWLAVLGWFLISAARAEETQIVLASQLSGVTVRDVMTPDPVTAPAELTVDDVLARFVLLHRFSAFPLVTRDGAVVGLVTLARVKQVPADQRAATPVQDVAWGLPELTTAAPTEPLLDVVARLGDAGDGRVLVFDAGRLVGILSPTDVSRAVQLAALRRPGSGAGVGTGTAPGTNA